MELKPCPFCGGTALKVYGSEDFFWIHCFSCDSEGPVKESEEEVIEAWNRRA